MNPSEPPANSPSEGGLQFDRAEFKGDAAIKCVSCQAPIAGQYFQVNGQAVCPACREQIAQFGMGGSKSCGFARAALGGSGAAVAGFLIYWAIRAISGYEFGLIAILVGWMVGMAVRWGSERLGGLFYQLLAVTLTYFSICARYVP